MMLRRIRISRFFSIANKFELDPRVPAFLKQSDHIGPRFIGPREEELQEMLRTCNAKSLEHLTELIVPEQVRDKHALQGREFPEGISESASLKHMLELANKNHIHKNFLGQGYYGTNVPPVILRNVFENPGWYTAYTPYQAEISQGRLESLMNYQTAVADLTGMEVSNASLLDEATAASEAMYMAFQHNDQQRKIFFIDLNVFPQSIALCKTKASFLGVEIVIGDARTYNFDKHKDQVCGLLVQSPNNLGEVVDYSDLFSKLDQNIIKIVGTDLLALTLIKTPGEQGANIAYGNSQRFGVPMGYGGPHAAFLATKGELVRKMPGRIIGISKDVHGKQAFRMSLMTREQHIRREKATSNICTAQALLANMAGMYAVYHGPEGLKRIANRVNGLAQTFARAAQEGGYELVHKPGEFFDTVVLRLADSKHVKSLRDYLLKHETNVRIVNDSKISFSFDETHTFQDVAHLVDLIYTYKQSPPPADILKYAQQDQIKNTRKTTFLQQEIFNSLHSEHQMTRYLNYLQQRDISLIHSMITLGSCTMKLNPTSFMIPVTYRGFSQLHPYAPRECAQGYEELAKNLEKWLCAVTGFAGVSLQPNSGAQGEYAGLLVISKYHLANNTKRDICLIPTSAHGTNPASAALAGMKVVPVATSHGHIDIKDLQKKLHEYNDKVSCIMITYPSTHGVYEGEIKNIIKLVHDYGGLVYMDGANMNAQTGLTSPGYLGADVCHLNLHKTFSIPHGGGGPGMGPIGVVDKLVPFLPKMYDEDSQFSVGQVAGAKYGSASILPISYSYLVQLGFHGVKKCTQVAMLNANYMMKQLEQDFTVLYKGQNDMCAHEFILDVRNLKQRTGITEEDIAKRLMDYGFHAPTMSFPVAGTLMIEPTESEDKAELDRFIAAMKNIRKEIEKVENGQYDPKDNPLKNAPHTQEEVCANEWKHGYSREEAAFPLPYIKQRGKFWPSVGRVQNAYGDRNLITSVSQKSHYL